MRRGRSFLILVVIALGLGAYAYFVESKRNPEEAATTQHDKVFDVKTGTIDQIVVTSASGEVTRLEKKDSTWRIVAPDTLASDDSAIGSLVSTLETVEVQRVVDENPADLKPFGLEPPQYSVAFRAGGDSTMRKLSVGAKTPTGADVYARVEGQPKLVLIPAYASDSLNKSTFDLRDKKVLQVAQGDVDSLQVEAAGQKPVTLARKNGDWQLTKPLTAKADSTVVEGLVGQVAGARMKSIVAQGEKPDLKKYGLDKPQATVTIGTGSSRATLQVGAKQDETSLYARDLSRPMVFTVDSSLLDGLKKTPGDYRPKDIFEFRSFTALGGDFSYGGKTYSFKKEKVEAKDATSPTEVWKQTRPEAKDVDQTRMADLLTGLSNLRADTFADKPLASGEDLTVTVRFGEEASPKTETVTLRKSGNTVQAIRPGDTGAAVVPAADADTAFTQFKELVGIK